MGDKGLDFKHKEVINITDGKRLRTCTRCMCRFRNRKNNLYNGCKKENRYKFEKSLIESGYMSFAFERERRKKDYVTKKNQKRTGYVVKEQYVYDVICKVEL